MCGFCDRKNKPKCVKTEYVDGKRIKADTFYKLIDGVFAEVKALNKRRRKLYENEYITYVCQKFNLNPTEIVATWKERFGTYSAFMNWLRE